MAIIISTSNFNEATSINRYYLNANFKIVFERYYYFLNGEVYNITIEELISIVIDKDINKINSVVGDFSLIVYDVVEDSLYFMNDKAGRNLIYYTVKEENLTISDDFWSIVYHNKQTLDDIDTLELKTQLFFSSSSTHSTILKSIYIFENAIFAIYQNDKLIKNKYWFFKQKENSLTILEKYDALDNALNESFKIIKKYNNDNIVYGIGVSGGMDSRIIPYYAFKNNMKLKSFIIGEERPNIIFKSNDHTSSDLVVDYFKLEHSKLEYNELSYKEKNELDCIYNPIGSSQIFKVPNVNKCTFDVLLTGASGFIVGSSPFYTKNRSLQLLDTIFIQQSDLKLKTKFYRVKKALNYIFGDLFSIKDTIPTSLKNIISRDEIEKIKLNNKKYLDKNINLTDTEKLMNYAIGVLGQKNKSGSFESILNQKKSYTPYTPFLLDIVSTWSDEDLYDRKLFENFIVERLPELAGIKQQNHKPSINIRNPSIFNKLVSLITYILKGQGVMNYNNWATKKDYQNFVKSELETNNYISKFIDIEQIKTLVYGKRLNADVLANCIKMNTILKMIDNINEENDEIHRNN